MPVGKIEKSEKRSIAELMDELAVKEGMNPTSLPGVELFRVSHRQKPTKLNYRKGIIIVGQGSKLLRFGGRIYRYNKDNYLVLSVYLPVECEIIAKSEEPLLSLFLEINMVDLGRIIEKTERFVGERTFPSEKKVPPLFVSQTTREIKDSVRRLLTVLKSPVETEIMGRGIVNEILFRILCSENAASLYSLFMNSSHLSRVDKAVVQIHQNYNQPIYVEKLAEMVNMSSSSFYRTFKEVTSLSPIQYIKKVRLNKARDLFLDKDLRISEVAEAVGYESLSQFSREFKRHFGESPTNFR